VLQRLNSFATNKGQDSRSPLATWRPSLKKWRPRKIAAVANFYFNIIDAADALYHVKYAKIGGVIKKIIYASLEARKFYPEEKEKNSNFSNLRDGCFEQPLSQ